MTRDNKIARAVRHALWMSAMTAAATIPAYAQDQDSEQQTQTVVVTGSRIIRQDYEANSPIATVGQSQLVDNADITLESALNTLPQIVPGGTSTTNNPPNNGQANIDLRGLGANRNLILIDGRRPMVSANDLTVDLNTIPAALIENVEVITGGAGAVYGADAVAGVVNVKLKHNFEGFNLSGTYSDSTKRDSEDYNVSALLGGNFADGRGNAVFAFDRSSREELIKAQRDFAAVATATTGTPPEGNLRWNTNAPSLAAVQQVFAGYGVAPTAVESRSGKFGFNQDGTLFAVGTFNSPLDVQHYTDPLNPLVQNPRFFPDLYSYNFDPVNLLTLPLHRNSFMTDLHYDLGHEIELFGNGSWTNYKAATGLAPSPVPGVRFAASGLQDPGSEVGSPLITPGATACGGARCSFTSGIPVPVTNPFVQALPDLMTLLNSRTGDDPALVGTGAAEPFLMGFRPVSAGLRQENFENTVVQYLAGVRGPIANSGWRFEAYYSVGRTEITDVQQGNIDTQKVTDLLNAPDGGASQCDGGFNIFGNGLVSQDCLDFVKVTTSTKLTMRQRIGQAFVTGGLADLPAGELSLVVGGEVRDFDYTFDPGSGAGPISGFNTQDPEAGTNEFRDVFTELAVPLLRDAPGAKALDVTFGYRFSRSQFTDDLNNFTADAAHSNSYKMDVSWQPIDLMRVRASYQRAARAPNFGELFQGGGSFPQIFDPCSVNTAARTGSQGAQITALCAATGTPGVASFVGTPGTQAEIDTDGNPNLKPEKADTYTFGLVFGPPGESRWTERLRTSIDYWNIKVKEAILVPDPNVGIAECYNYYGTNSSFNPADPYCNGIFRSGGNIVFLGDFARDPDNGVFAALNGGTIKTNGVDFQVDYGFDLDWMGLPANSGGINMNLLISRLFEYKLQDTPGVPEIDYAGTVNYFGGGISLGQTLPKWKATLNTQWNMGKFAIAARTRFIDKMDNRASVQFPGETFKGVGSVAYWDFAAAYKFMDKSEIRIGLNNAFDKQPPTYDPNVQSGTDPSTYDIIGRTAFVRMSVTF
jgi:outer membrane receptor protein involved in Fe transport